MGSNACCLGVPVKDRARALMFYSAVLGRDLREQGASPPSFEPRATGNDTILHLRIDGGLDAALAVVWSSGGRILDADALDLDRRYALVLDSEGNRVALYTDAGCD